MWRRRADGTLVRGLANTRRVMPYLMRGRNESAVYFEHEMSLRKADAFVRAWNEANPMLRIDIFHLALWAMRDLIERNPSVNRFVAGGRIYLRDGIWFSYAVKQRLEVGTPLIVIKRRFDTDESFGAMVECMLAEQSSATSAERNTVDKELGLLLFFPGFVRRIIMAVVRNADRLGFLPRGFIDRDPMYTSTFFANMASLGMPPVYHHLYEYGTCSVFGSIGRPVAEPGSPTSGPDRRRVMTVRWTYDERGDDGLNAWYALRRFKQVIEDPEASGLVVVAVPSGAAPPSSTPNGTPAAGSSTPPVVTPAESAAAPVDS
jgi:hypothetical protein